MFDFTSLNKEYSSPFTYELGENAKYLKPSDLEEEKVYIMRSIFINHKGKFGEHPVCIVEADNEDKGFYISLPAHLTKVAKAILENDEAIEAINERKCGVKARKYYSKTYNKEGYTVDFVNIK